jgi:hypothetical protein
VNIEPNECMSHRRGIVIDQRALASIVCALPRKPDQSSG